VNEFLLRQCCGSLVMSNCSFPELLTELSLFRRQKSVAVREREKVETNSEPGYRVTGSEGDAHVAAVRIRPAVR